VGKGAHLAHGHDRGGDFFVFLFINEVFGSGSGGAVADKIEPYDDGNHIVEGSIAIPKALRERLNQKAGTEVMMDVLGEALVLKRVAPELPDWRTMEGMAKGEDSLTEALEEDRAAENAHYDARINQGR
jgi:bifunctional DNA-binding transcriptional regulator/antitoxin component of YhaV-PrlF toxin-antitoxin module